MDPMRVFVGLLLNEPMVAAIVVFLVVAAVTRSWRSATAGLSPRARTISRVIRAGAIAVLVVDVGVRLLPGVLARLPHATALWSYLTPSGYWWWAFPLPLSATVITLAIIVVRVRSMPTRVETAVVPLARRNWLSFSRRSDVATAAGVGGMLLLLSILSGLASATDQYGRHTVIVIPTGEMDTPVDVSGLPEGSENATSGFYGWAFSLPVIAVAVVLAVLLYLVLRNDSARPFVRPDEAAGDTSDRRATAAGVWRLTAGALGLTLGAALALVASAGLSSSGVGIPEVGTFMWSVGYSAFAPAMDLTSVLIRIGATLSLLLLAGGRRERPVRVRATAQAVKP
jgi:hypothetical protein